jgi:hypothetical protein
MKPCIVGIGGTGGNILKQFLKIQDIDLVVHKFGDHLAFGDVKGIWIDSASQDVENPKQAFYGSLEKGSYPCYLISHDTIDANSPTRQYVIDKYGFDLKAQGYDRRAEYLKGIFEIFDYDSDLKEKAYEEFYGEKNPLPSYIWRRGIRPFTTISKRYGNENDTADPRNSGPMVYTKGPRALSALTSMLGAKKNNQATKPSKCDSILFVASLGGGTGTGFINPITSYVRSEELAFPILAMGILTEKGTEAREATEGQRDLGAVIAMNDLLTKKPGEGIDGLIIIDNQILADRFHKNWLDMDRTICRAMNPMLDKRSYPGAEMQEDAPAMRRVFWEADKTNGAEEERTILLPPFLVPCYHRRMATGRSVDSLIEKALEKQGRLFPCDPRKADRAYVFSRGFFSDPDIDEAMAERTGLLDEKVKVYRKIGDSRTEDVLILLRDPYGGSSDAHLINDTFEWRMYDVINEAIKYIEENPTNIIEYMGFKDFTKEHLLSYFYGESGLKEELKKCLERLEKGVKPIFQNPLSIFGGVAVATKVQERTLIASPVTKKVDEKKLKEMVREELEDILNSEDCKNKIKEIINS